METTIKQEKCLLCKYNHLHALDVCAPVVKSHTVQFKDLSLFAPLHQMLAAYQTITPYVTIAFTVATAVLQVLFALLDKELHVAMQAMFQLV